ncbi:neuronal acetylcholine receptor subunit alpha-6-like [Ylistrum balloti]|uniref:neuronal acetylcholine receptor subunit alpha-6-like n=1 Tax=Ylistrum balloti TaxID=509963 RepID=UPI002905912C|nr:neuronal acetylcholine receptor subunit alpha-6-like [Ylistrum balloti]
MIATAYLYLSWKDNHITWTPDSYGGINHIYIPQNDIWKPDIALANGYSKMTVLGDNFILTRISHEGLVEWLPYEVFETKCSIDISEFPFDVQTCNITFGVWTSSMEAIDIDFIVGKNTIDLESYQENSKWDLVSTAADTLALYVEGTMATFSFTFRRRSEYYMYNIVVPVMLLSFLAVFTFVLPIESGEKMGFCMTVYLAFAVFLTIVGESLPVSSTQSLLSKYLFVLMMMGTVIIILTTIELRISYRHTSSHEIPLLLIGLVHISRRIQCRHLDKVSDLDKGSEKMARDENEELPTEHNLCGSLFIETSWSDVTAAVDFFSFWIFLAINTIATSVIFTRG